MIRFINYLLLFLIFGSFVSAQVRVRSYFRKDGTFVQSHYRTFPDNSRLNNWSTKGNLNPYTGKEGTIDLYKNSIPQTRVYKDYVQYSYSPTVDIEKSKTIINEIKTKDSMEYIIIRREDSRMVKPAKSNRRVIIYE